jgi:hypothetical protein
MTDEARRGFVAYRLAQSEEALGVARSTVDASPTAAVNRAFYAATAALAMLGLDLARHTGVIAAVHRRLIHSGQLDKDAERQLQRLFEQRQQADYRAFAAPSVEAAHQAVADAEAFVTAIRAWLAANPNPE